MRRADARRVAVSVSYIWIPRTRQRFAGQCRAYPELFALMGSQVPDFRGLFLRGHGGKSAELGVQQGDAIRNVTGTFDARVAGMWREGTGPFRVGGGGGQKVAVDGYGYPYDVNFDLSRCVPTASENRPVNQAVRYLIRALP